MAIFLMLWKSLQRPISINPGELNFNQKNSLLEWNVKCKHCVWTQSLLQIMSPWLLLLPLWLSLVSHCAQTPMPAMGRALLLLLLHSARLKLKRLLLPSKPILGSSNRKNRRMANRWTKSRSALCTAHGIYVNSRMDEHYDKIYRCILICKCTCVWLSHSRAPGLVTQHYQ